MTTVDHGGEVTVRPVIGPSPILAGDVFRHELASGAGWGDPLERDPAAVLRDVRNGVIGVGRALADYGVVIAADETVDVEATAASGAGGASARATGVRARARPKANPGLEARGASPCLSP